jgi:hypothetical protein
MGHPVADNEPNCEGTWTMTFYRSLILFDIILLKTDYTMNINDKYKCGKYM